MAYFLDFSRLYWIGLLIGLSEPIFRHLEVHTEVSWLGLPVFGIPGVFILAIGIITLIRFVQSHPLLEEGGSYGQKR
jgi:hypothetical protein